MKNKWKHDRQCTYCQTQDIPPEKFSQGNGKPDLTGCKHFRGGKTRAKRAK